MSDMGTQIRDYLDGTTAPIGARELIMGSTFTEERDSAPPKRQPPWRWAAVAIAAAAVIAIGLFLLPGDGDDVAPIDQPDGDGAPTETTVEAASGAVAVVEEAIDAFERGDVDTIGALTSDDDDPLLGWLLGPADVVRAKAAANGRFVLDEPCRPGDGDFVVCEGTETNDYWGAAGLERPGRLLVEVTDGLIGDVEFLGADPDDRLVEFGEAFLSWLEATHPAVVAGLPSSDDVEFGAGVTPIELLTTGLPNPQAMPTALVYVDEFVAQSPDYPVGAPFTGPGVEEALATAEALLDAYNAADEEALGSILGWDTGEDETYGYLFGPRRIVDEALASQARLELAAPCTAVGPAEADLVLVDCVAVQTSQFFGPAGIGVRWYVTMTIDPSSGELVSVDNHAPYDQSGLRLAADSGDTVDGPYGPVLTYGQAFMEWFYANHRDVADSIGVDAGGTWPISFFDTGIPLPEAMPTAIEYVDEFLAQSPDYPITP